MINFYLLGEKGNVSLRSINKDNHSLINLVIVGQDKNVINDYSKEIIDYCKSNNFNYLLQNRTVYDTSAKYSIAIGWRWLIDDSTKLIVFHDSILPKLRGFNPLVTALINGESKIGVSVLFGTNDFDRGEIIIQKITSISYPIKIQSAIEKLSCLYSDALNDLLLQIKKNNIISVHQDESLATYSLWRDNEDYRIDWSKSSEYINRFINAVGYPYKSAFTTLNNTKLLIKDSYIEEDVFIENRTPGKVLFKKNNRLIIVCGKGLLGVENFYNDDEKKVEIRNFRIKFI